MNDYYSYSLDIWSIGCIFAELLSMMRDNFADFTDRQPLFPGSSCYKLSPKEKTSVSFNEVQPNQE